MPRVLIIGGGPAGLTAALRLAEHSYRVTLIDRSGAWGGRLMIDAERDQADRIPHILMGCHHATRSMLKDLGVQSAFHTTSFDFVGSGSRRARLHRPFMPGAWSTLLGIAAFRGVSIRDRCRLLAWLERTWERDPGLATGLDSHTAEVWLRGIGQSEDARRRAWEPLCRFLLGDGLNIVSAAPFITALATCFLSQRHDSELKIPADTMSRLLVQPAVRRLNRFGVVLRLNTAATRIDMTADRVTGVALEDGGRLTADWYIAAVPHAALAPLLPERAVTRFTYFQQLARLTDSPMLATHLRIEPAPAHAKLVLVEGRTYHWLVVKPNRDGGGAAVSFVSSGRPDLLGRPDEELVEAALADWRAYHRGPAARATDPHIVRDSGAGLSLRPGVQACRPLQQSPMSNFYVGGAWTDTGLPTTVESAIISGELCAQGIAGKDHDPTPERH